MNLFEFNKLLDELHPEKITFITENQKAFSPEKPLARLRIKQTCTQIKITYPDTISLLNASASYIELSGVKRIATSDNTNFTITCGDLHTNKRDLSINLQII